MKFKEGQIMRQTFGTSYYVAPEVLEGRYNERCDIWSVGVVLYILLSGKPPFTGADDLEISNNVRFTEVMLHTAEWRKKSRDCIDFIRRLMLKDITKRSTAEEALEHPWLERMRKQRIQKGFSIASAGKASRKEILGALNNLRSLKASSKLQQAVLTIIATQILPKEEIDPIRRVFGMIDEDNSGIVTRGELVEMFFKYLGDSVTDIELDRMLSIVDADMSGEIGFSEFVIACIDPKRAVNPEHLRSLFALFDADKSGDLSMHEIKYAICAGRNLDDRLWL
jgi:calcium-dependent protein kinase